MVKSEIRSRPRVVLVNRCLVADADKRILFIRRAAHEVWGAGKWEFPGGKLDAGQDVSQALEREVIEETGLYVSLESQVAYIESHLMGEGKYKGLPYVLIVGKAKLIGGKVKLSMDHSEYVWLKKEKGLDLDLTEETRKALLSL